MKRKCDFKIEIKLNIGDQIEKETPLFSISVMKVENLVKSQFDCKIKAIRVIFIKKKKNSKKHKNYFFQVKENDRVKERQL